MRGVLVWLLVALCGGWVVLRVLGLERGYPLVPLVAFTPFVAGAAAADEVGAGLKGTWPRGRRFPPPVAIDHVLADARIGVRAFSVHTITGTDHRAVLADLVLPRG